MRHAQEVTGYYFAHIKELTREKQFHWASRLAAWTRDPRAFVLLRECRANIVPQPLTHEALRTMFKALLGRRPGATARFPAFAERKPYFAKYPALFGAELALFRLRHLGAAYGIDAREQFLQTMPISELEALASELLDDPAALSILSTFAINFLYLLRRVVLHDDEGIDVEALYNLGDRYDTSDDEQLRLMIYLYTHCIVAESNFYQRPLPAPLLPVYQRMLRRLEPLVQEHFMHCSLDTKLEFLVCCRICNYQTPLFAQIDDECSQSLSPNGTFVVDTLNSFSRLKAKVSFASSEHRNALYVMSSTPYRPAAR